MSLLHHGIQQNKNANKRLPNVLRQMWRDRGDAKGIPGSKGARGMRPARGKEMNIEEAREIVNRDSATPQIGDTHTVSRASGFIEGYESIMKELSALQAENQKLRSVVIACSKEPMPDWSKKIWELNEELREKDAEIKHLIEALSEDVKRVCDQEDRLRKQLQAERERSKALIEALEKVKNLECDCSANEIPGLPHCCDGRATYIASEALAKYRDASAEHSQANEGKEK